MITIQMGMRSMRIRLRGGVKCSGRTFHPLVTTGLAILPSLQPQRGNGCTHQTLDMGLTLCILDG
jgi:hypothetical protein